MGHDLLHTAAPQNPWRAPDRGRGWVKDHSFTPLTQTASAAHQLFCNRQALPPESQPQPSGNQPPLKPPHQPPAIRLLHSRALQSGRGWISITGDDSLGYMFRWDPSTVGQHVMPLRPDRVHASPRPVLEGGTPQPPPPPLPLSIPGNGPRSPPPVLQHHGLCPHCSSNGHQPLCERSEDPLPAAVPFHCSPMLGEAQSCHQTSETVLRCFNGKKAVVPEV